MKIFRLENNDSDDPNHDYYDFSLIIADSIKEAKELSIIRYNPNRRRFAAWPSKEEEIECIELGISNPDLKKGQVVASSYVGG